ncbi:MAG: TetR family transcriptional regulator [Rhizobacter sp.]|nr:TetR family transcriptional regulator [Rhizobacter sp.]
MASGHTRIELTKPPKPPESGAGARTYELLMSTAMTVIQDGHVPSIAELAVRAKVSRATAYRYFPSRSVLITAVVDTSLGPVRSWKSEKTDGRERVKEMFATTFPSFKQFEPQLRAAVQLSLEQWALERAGLLEEEPYRRGHRVGILTHALQPLEGQINARTLDKLRKALSVVYGIEPHIVLKDIWGSSDREVEAIALWMADALVAAALRDGTVEAKTKPVGAKAVKAAKTGKTAKTTSAAKTTAASAPRTAASSKPRAKTKVTAT